MTMRLIGKMMKIRNNTLNIGNHSSVLQQKNTLVRARVLSLIYGLTIRRNRIYALLISIVVVHYLNPALISRIFYLRVFPF